MELPRYERALRMVNRGDYAMGGRHGVGLGARSVEVKFDRQVTRACNAVLARNGLRLRFSGDDLVRTDLELDQEMTHVPGSDSTGDGLGGDQPGGQGGEPAGG